LNNETLIFSELARIIRTDAGSRLLETAVATKPEELQLDPLLFETRITIARSLAQEMNNSLCNQYQNTSDTVSNDMKKRLHELEQELASLRRTSKQPTASSQRSERSENSSPQNNPKKMIFSPAAARHSTSPQQFPRTPFFRPPKGAPTPDSTILVNHESQSSNSWETSTIAASADEIAPQTTLTTDEPEAPEDPNIKRIMSYIRKSDEREVVEDVQFNATSNTGITRWITEVRPKIPMTMKTSIVKLSEEILECVEAAKRDSDGEIDLGIKEII
jgi:hypothetical protein